MRISDWSSDVCSSDLTCERFRSSRHTSMPETFGSITSSSTTSGRTASNISSAASPSLATCTRKPSRDSPTVRRSEEHTSELQSLMRISYAVFCLKKKKKNTKNTQQAQQDLTSTPTTTP